MTAERILSERELNRALLARQLLLERATSPIPRAIEGIGGLQTQYAPSAYIGLWSRVDGLERDHLTRALERRAVIQGTLMRVTIHMVSARDYWPMTEAIRRARRGWWLAATRRRAVERDAVEAAERVRALLADGPRRRGELMKELGVDSTTWNGVGMWLGLVRVPPSGTWDRRSADLYGLAEGWLGPSEATQEQGVELLVRRYLGGFGPASRKDLASWAGLPPAAFAPALDRMKLRRFEDPRAGSSSTSRARRCPIPPRPRRSGSSPRGTRPCLCTRAERRSCPSGSDRASSTPRPRTRDRRSWSTGRWPGRGAWSGAAWRSSPSSVYRGRRSGRSTRRRIASSCSTGDEGFALTACRPRARWPSP